MSVSKYIITFCTTNRFARLLRLNSPIPILLMIAPVLWVVFIYSNHKLLFSTIFIIGGFLTRSLGCVINDMTDYQLDQKVYRTMNRPIASGEITLLEALGVVIVLALPSMFLLLQLPNNAIEWGLYSSLLILIYPKAKLFTNFPQIILGITYNMGVIISYYTFNEEFSTPLLAIYLASVFWTIGFDSIYAYQDRKYDINEKVGSVAVKLGKKGKIFISCCYTITICCLVILGIQLEFSYVYYLFVALGVIHLYWQIETLNIENPKDCKKKFDSNAIFALLILSATIFSKSVFI
ncbi:4-hydroxybenzoate octaprenyltransferase [Candidatus Cyrtobacter comes]|uniref:4-hydroxybenzoate octaprenyltransferase n=1 Tax=Candidatus Cyrtobacter comes TaxID=675776 RepID=A0ABU5L7V2_9RICK|nr:4-hydroxybenzoate octaprenyltransferase [Candidatus Cyrtobacter comes]MDZ5762206.1 4-hydroxybenzoate octaprenyltransferase [Candidatus Cyrtobacter comes]